MSIIVKKGNVTIQNYVEAGAKVEQKYYGTVYQGSVKDMEEDDAEANSSPQSLRDVIEMVVKHVVNSRTWFAVYKGMVEAGCTDRRDYKGFKKLVDGCGAVLPYPINPDELSRLDTLSWSKSIDEWDITDAPLKRPKEFYAYKDLAQLTYDLAERLDV